MTYHFFFLERKRDCTERVFLAPPPPPPTARVYRFERKQQILSVRRNTRTRIRQLPASILYVQIVVLMTARHMTPLHLSGIR